MQTPVRTRIEGDTIGEQIPEEHESETRSEHHDDGVRHLNECRGETVRSRPALRGAARRQSVTDSLKSPSNPSLDWLAPSQYCSMPTATCRHELLPAI